MGNSQIKSYDTTVKPGHREKFGQFFTPLEVATFMCRWVMRDDTLEVFDPGFGLGVFYTAARTLKKNIKFYASETDPVILDFKKKTEPAPSELFISHEDYLSAWGKKHSGIVCNPPYMRFQHFKNRDKIAELFQRHLKIRLSGYTNSASAFLLKSLSELRRNGRLAYIMPLEFLNTGYGTLVKEELLRDGRLKALISLQGEREIFPDAITSIGIVLVANDSKTEPVRFYSAKSITELSSILDEPPTRAISFPELSPSEKWLKHFESLRAVVDASSLFNVKHFGTFSRGIATGANEFFILSPTRAKELKIPAWTLSKCITRSSQIRQSIFTEDDLDKLRRDDEEIYLLNVNGKTTPSVTEYIQSGEKERYHERYLTKMRKPWYKVEKRNPAPLLFAVFSRERFKVIRNYSAAINLTCFHGFYPNEIGRGYIDHLFLYFQSKTARQILSLNMRRYGDGLEKFEPNDLNHSLAPTPAWFDSLSPSLLEDGMKAIRSGASLPQSLEKAFSSLVTHS